jgi:anti-anti-sigma regulatory factor
MYENSDEAVLALTPKTAKPGTEIKAPSPWPFQSFTVSQSINLVFVEFNKTRAFDAATVSELRSDLAQLADRLDRGSKVLFDFTGVEVFCASSIEELALFNRRLRNKGSRIVLCCLDATVHESFFT